MERSTPAAREPARAFPRCRAAATAAEACTGVVDDLHERWALPSVYLLIDGRLRCQASRGYFQVSDGFSPDTGVIGRVVSSGEATVIPDVRDEPTFIAAIPGLRAEVCVPVRCGDEVVGAVNVESFDALAPDALDDLQAAAAVLGDRLHALGGLPPPSLAQRVAQVSVSLATLTDVAAIERRVVEAAVSLAGMSSAALARTDAEGCWSIRQATGPLGSDLLAWDDSVLRVISRWVWAGTSSYFPDGEDVPDGYEFLRGAVHAMSVQPLAVAGQVTGLLLCADSEPVAHDPSVTTAMELLATQTAATLATAQTMQALESQASQDPLTGLTNRRRLLECLQAELALSDGLPSSALVLLDLDGFKGVNDRHGHARGDALLQDVAARLRAVAREGDVVCRLGGDEFAVLVRGLASPQDALVAAQRMVESVSGASAGTSAVAASAGVRLLERGFASASTLLVDADAALYAAKRSGRGRAVCWQPRLRTDAAEQVRLADDLRAALDAGNLTLAYQPVVEIETMRVRGLEALARWHDPRRGDVPPAVFVKCAEATGLMSRLTRWVLETACREAASWPETPDGSVPNVAVNISAMELADDGVVHAVRGALLRSGLPAHRLVLEVTESAAVVDLDQAKDTLDALSGLGVVLALDDFGTGYSSLTHAQALPFDILKIDRSFVAGAAQGDRRSVATVAAVCALAGRLEVDVVAEGIDDLDHLLELLGLGCEYAQGFGIARPMSAAAVRNGMRTQGEDGWVLAPAVPAPRAHSEQSESAAS